VDQQWNWRESQALARRLKNAELRTANACVEEIDYRNGCEPMTGFKPKAAACPTAGLPQTGKTRHVAR